METTYIIFPITILMAAIFMQLGSYMNERVNPKLQVFIGGMLICGSLNICSYIKNYVLFIFIYSVVVGMSFGILYMPGLKNAWQYFPSKKGLISGLILSCFSVGAILWTVISKAVANPRNEKPME
jgi:MFS transporter, OFA family, oxalate/formate antiporter